MDTPQRIIPGETLILHVQQHDRLARLDQFLVAQLPHYSRTYFQDLIEAGHIHIQGLRISKPSSPLLPGMAITIALPAEKPRIIKVSEAVAALKVKLIFEHDHFAIISKPAGLVVHSPASGMETVTLVDWLLARLPALATEDTERPGIIHRLDKDTSGLMIIAKDPQAFRIVSDLFQQRAITKRYLAIVHGTPPQTGSIDFNIVRHPTKRVQMTHSRTLGRRALTKYNVLSYGNDHSLIEAYPATGRTHQIRVHCAAIEHPIVGDAVYYKPSKLIPRQALHAAGLSFTYQGIDYSFEDPMPEDMQQICTALGLSL